jgi:ABC-type dipeptide/oligopeptide/nickel transport system permease subunit
MMLFPGILLLLITFSFNVLGDGLRDAITGGS